MKSIKIKKHICILILSFYVSSLCYPLSKQGEDEIHIFAEVMPVFQGGEHTRLKFLAEHVKYPQSAIESGIQGVVYVGFIVEKDGSLTDIKILRGIGGGCDEEAIRVVQNMPNWKSGMIEGKPVRVQFTMPIKFAISNNLKRNDLLKKHEIGFSIGLLPLIGGWSDGFLNPKPVGGQKMGHTYHVQEGKNFEKMHHFGSYNIKYNYNFNLKHSIGVSFSWVAKHVDIYWHYPAGSVLGRGRPAITVEGSGWIHYFTLQGSYRRNYHRGNITSSFFEISYGTSLYSRDKAILSEEKITFLLGSISNDRHIFAPAFHLTVLGIEFGKKNAFNLEFGVGTQGILQMGFKHKF
jgi:TonB family protein